MSDIAIEQARFRRDDNAVPVLQARSAGFQEDWLPAVERLLLGFGRRDSHVACPAAVFARPLGTTHVAIVQVADLDSATELHFHVLVVPRVDYERYLGNPFEVARRFPPAWRETGTLPTLSLPSIALPARTIREVQSVLRRVKAAALKEDEDPEHPEFERNESNSESPALLGGVQVLVEGGKLVFERPGPDPDLIEGLWTLLPHTTRARLWPASFALGNDLEFDALVVPRVRAADFEGYTSEEQAADYPAGHYEMALQVAAEAGNERELDALLNRRSGGETLKLGWILLVIIVLLVLAPRLLEIWQPPTEAQDVRLKAAAATGIVAAGDPWTALALKLHGDALWKKP